MEQALKSMTFDFFGKGQHKIMPEKLLGMEKAVFLDVRSNEEIASVPLPLGIHANVTSLHIPINEVPERLAEIPKDAMVGVFCPHGVRASMVYVYLRSKGYEQVKVVGGGYAAVTDALMPGKLLAAL
ncbi:rhodanese-like domain-containing protein [Pontiellaceae bacterium B1224]|nr:rhodanese-like domain-containing protein [Pontiellaceae bacterium B1224]